MKIIADKADLTEMVRAEVDEDKPEEDIFLGWDESKEKSHQSLVTAAPLPAVPAHVRYSLLQKLCLRGDPRAR